MATNLQIDDMLITKAVKLGGHRTKKAAITQALIDYIQHLEQTKIVPLFGAIDYDPAYDYKRQRARRQVAAMRPGRSRSESCPKAP